MSADIIIALVVIATCGLVAWGRGHNGQARTGLAAFLLILSLTMRGLPSRLVLVAGVGVAVWSLWSLVRERRIA